VAEEDILERALTAARAYIASSTDRPVWPTVALADLRGALGGPLPTEPIDGRQVIDTLARAAEPGLVRRLTALLRVRHRRRPAGDGGGGVAHHRVIRTARCS
jgi:hypothetical protein